MKLLRPAPLSSEILTAKVRIGAFYEFPRASSSNKVNSVRWPDTAQVMAT